MLTRKAIFCHLLIIIFIVSSTSIVFGQGMITGSTTLGTEIKNVDNKRFTVAALVGERKVDFKYLTLNGRENSIKFNVKNIKQEVDLDDVSGSLVANMIIMKLGVAKEKRTGRHYLLIEGGSGPFEVRVEMDYEPGLSAITTSSVVSREALEKGALPYSIHFKHNMTDKTFTLTDKLVDEYLRRHVEPENWEEKYLRDPAEGMPSDEFVKAYMQAAERGDFIAAMSALKQMVEEPAFKAYLLETGEYAEMRNMLHQMDKAIAQLPAEQRGMMIRMIGDQMRQAFQHASRQ